MGRGETSLRCENLTLGHSHFVLLALSFPRECRSEHERQHGNCEVANSERTGPTETEQTLMRLKIGKSSKRHSSIVDWVQGDNVHD